MELHATDRAARPVESTSSTCAGVHLGSSTRGQPGQTLAAFRLPSMSVLSLNVCHTPDQALRSFRLVPRRADPARHAVEDPGQQGPGVRPQRPAGPVRRRSGPGGTVRRGISLPVPVPGARQGAVVRRTAGPARGHGTTVTGHFALRTSRTASDPPSRLPGLVDEPTTTLSARTSCAAATSTS